MADITMPQLGETVTEGTITRWAKKVGEEVAEDEVLFEVSTDKVDSEVPSPASGYLAEILVEEGQTVDVGTKLAVISSGPGGDGAPATSTASEETAQAVRNEVARAEAEESPKIAEDQPAPPPAPLEAPSGGPTGDGRLLSPVVRRLLSEHKLDPSTIQGTGSGGRITRADVLAVIDAGPSTGEGEARPLAEERQVSLPTERPAPPAGQREEIVPFSKIRKRTAEHMRHSLDTSTHTLVVMDVDYDTVDRVRQGAKGRFKSEEGIGLTYLPFITRAVVDAIHDFPYVNSSVGDDQLEVHRYVNMGVAVDLDFEGLIVPVVHDADGKRLRVLAREIADLADRARARKLSADDISGGTFTITNAGGYGTFVTAPIISQPQVAILSTDGIKPRPVAVPLPGGSYGIAVHPVGNLGLSFDHRAFDGAYASAFLARVKEILETRDWAQELA